MDEYISKQSVIDYLEGYINSIGECGADSLLFDRGQRRALINSIQDISVIKGADVQPVKHGRWIEKKVCHMKWIPYDDDDVNPDDVDIECMTEQKCSYCKRWTIKFTYHIELDYCPLCGARMDGDSDD